jgi:hypothetical protein
MTGSFLWYWIFIDIAINQLLEQKYSGHNRQTRAEFLFLQDMVITSAVRKEPLRNSVELRDPMYVSAKRSPHINRQRVESLRTAESFISEMTA